MGKATGLVLIVAVVLLFSSGALYIIEEKDRAIKLEFGKLVDSDLKPGLHIKVPVMHEIRRFEARVMLLDLDEKQYLTSEKKRLVVDSYVIWRIDDVKNYFVSMQGSTFKARSILISLVDEGLRNKFGERLFENVFNLNISKQLTSCFVPTYSHYLVYLHAFVEHP